MASPRIPQSASAGGSSLSAAPRVAEFLNPDNTFKDIVFLSGNVYLIQTSVTKQVDGELELSASLKPTSGILPLVSSATYQAILAQFVDSPSEDRSTLLIDENGFFRNIVFLDKKIYFITKAQLNIGHQQSLLANLKLIGTLPVVDPQPFLGQENGRGSPEEKNSVATNAAASAAHGMTDMLISGGQLYPIVSGQFTITDGQRQFSGSLAPPMAIFESISVSAFQAMPFNVAPLPAAQAHSASVTPAKKFRKHEEDAQSEDGNSEGERKDDQPKKKQKEEPLIADDTQMVTSLNEIHYIEFASALFLYRSRHSLGENKVHDLAPFFTGNFPAKQSARKSLKWKRIKGQPKTAAVKSFWVESNNQYKVWVYWNISGVRELILVAVDIKPGEYVDISVHQKEENPPVHKIRIGNDGVQELISKKWHPVGEQSLKYLFETVLLANVPYTHPLPKNAPITKDFLETIANESKGESLTYRLHQAFVTRAQARIDGEFISVFHWECKTGSVEFELTFNTKAYNFNTENSGASYNFSELEWYNLPELGGPEYAPYKVRIGKTFYKLSLSSTSPEEKADRKVKTKPILRYTFFHDAYYGELYGVEKHDSKPEVTGTVIQEIFNLLYKVVRPERKTLICDDSCIKNKEGSIRYPLRLLLGLTEKSTWYMQYGATMFACNNLKTLYEGKITQSMSQWLAALDRILVTRLSDWLQSFRTDFQKQSLVKLIARLYNFAPNEQAQIQQVINTGTIDSLLKKIYEVDGERHKPVIDSNMTIFLELLMNGTQDLNRISVKDWLLKLTLQNEEETITRLEHIANRYRDPATETLESLSCSVLINRIISAKNNKALPESIKIKHLTQAEKNDDDKFIDRLLESPHGPSTSLNVKHNKDQLPLLYNQVLVDVHTVLWSGRIWQFMGIENIPQESQQTAMRLG